MSQMQADTLEMPQVKGGVVPYLMVDGASRAARFYEEAFGAREVFRQPEDDQGRTMHIHLYIHEASIMLCDPYPEYGQPAVTPQGFTLTLTLGEEVDSWWARAIGAGVEVLVPLEKAFWGDRYGEDRDPFGFRWAFVGK